MLLKLRKNAQLTLPSQIRKAVHLDDGDVLDCEVRDGQIVLTPKKIVDKQDSWLWSRQWQKDEAEAQSDIGTGNVKEFENVDDLIAHLNKE
ncbi:MAG: AbrB/MazE/SpoVT family DNA-binding domain-containing protein [bacterium]|jgi:antitoxin MazE